VQTLVCATHSRRATIRATRSPFEQRRLRKRHRWFGTLLPPHNHMPVVLRSTPLFVGVAAPFDVVVVLFDAAATLLNVIAALFIISVSLP